VLSNIISIIVIIITSIIIIICSIGIITASKFQNKQRKKYKEVDDLIKKNKKSIFKIKDGLTKAEISKIDNEVDVDILINELFSLYIELENKIKNLDTNFDEILTGYIKDTYINKIENFKNKSSREVTEGIDLVNYNIIEYTKEKLKLRITINCFSYKINEDKIVSGSNLEKIERIILLIYKKINNKWLISDCDRIYERKLSN